MSWAPLPPAPDPVAITAVANAVIRSKITIPYHDGERVALEALRAALPWATLVVAKMPVSEALKWCVEHLGLIVGLMACPEAVAAAQAEIRRDGGQEDAA